MDNSKRSLLKALPMAALAGVAMKVGGKDIDAIEIAPTKRYILKVNADLTQEELDNISQTLKDKGFDDCLVVSGNGNVDVYELG